MATVSQVLKAATPTTVKTPTVTKTPVTPVEKTYTPEQIKALNGPGYSPMTLDQVKSTSTTQNVTPSQALMSTVPTISYPTIPTQNVVDNSAMIRQQAQAAQESALAALRQNIADSIAQQQQTITKAPQTYEPLRAQSEVQKASELHGALEQAANRGDVGGVGAQNTLETQIAGENRLNQINMQQQNTIDQANQQIAKLQSDGKFQEAQIVANNAQSLLQALTSEANRVSQEQYQQGQTQYGQQFQQAQLQQSQAKKATAQAKQDYQNTANQYYPDVTAEINRLNASNDPDKAWKIPILASIRQDKIAAMDSAKAKASQLQTQYAKDAYSQALERTKIFGQVQPQDEAILGIRAGTKTQAADIADLKMALSQAKVSKSGKSSGSSSGSSKTPSGEQPSSMTPLQQFNDFQKLLYQQADAGNPSSALQDLEANKESIVKLKGLGTYNEMYAAIQAKIKALAGSQYR